MTGLLLILGAAALLGVLALLRARHLRSVRTRIAEAAQRLGLRYPAGNLGYCSAEGAIDGRRVVIAYFEDQSATSRIVVATPRSGEISIVRETVGARLGKFVNGPDLKTGDEAFDRAVLIRCRSATRARAVLGAEARAQVTALLQRAPGAVIGENDISLDTSGTPKSADWLCEVIESFVRVGSELAIPENIAELLERNAKEDPVPGVRIECLTSLWRSFAGQQAAIDALDRAMRDPDAGVRHAAAALSGLLDGAEPGRVSLTEPAGGELSQAERPGALSVSSPKKGQTT